ncbi:uncharacterized protein MONOS_7165 [Monocercomonoides exilis]|uniref:uncharacterized protein n=1 Tax=Monocercomonoides exilis TaxID=2049356 RepID=UPI0035599850|nr:hypothetical protein MONOS_7165 [Monocercomonoides exilis]|eukprot:MONOS_7165.1-p1 / transcript=MONOS_7165.1 / gene=MONOS_7165 / organism=Monocercomonoides_exilis_PA203 / gene_product=unspecified product / transcript_product=unspecified product / location=Mono_scaffold00239:1872-8894(+) / protein_length=2084 / sequence_SO=supercontig / SO=protein_coding / is_pseudo=false
MSLPVSNTGYIYAKIQTANLSTTDHRRENHAANYIYKPTTYFTSRSIMQTPERNRSIDSSDRSTKALPKPFEEQEYNRRIVLEDAPLQTNTKLFFGDNSVADPRRFVFIQRYNEKMDKDEPKFAKIDAKQAKEKNFEIDSYIDEIGQKEVRQGSTYHSTIEEICPDFKQKKRNIEKETKKEQLTEHRKISCPEKHPSEGKQICIICGEGRNSTENLQRAECSDRSLGSFYNVKKLNDTAIDKIRRDCHKIEFKENLPVQQKEHNEDDIEADVTQPTSKLEKIKGKDDLDSQNTENERNYKERSNKNNYIFDEDAKQKFSPHFLTSKALQGTTSITKIGDEASNSTDENYKTTKTIENFENDAFKENQRGMKIEMKKENIGDEGNTFEETFCDNGRNTEIYENTEEEKYGNQKKGAIPDFELTLLNEASLNDKCTYKNEEKFKKVDSSFLEKIKKSLSTDTHSPTPSPQENDQQQPEQQSLAPVGVALATESHNTDAASNSILTQYSELNNDSISTINTNTDISVTGVLLTPPMMNVYPHSREQNNQLSPYIPSTLLSEDDFLSSNNAVDKVQNYAVTDPQASEKTFLCDEIYDELLLPSSPPASTTPFTFDTSSASASSAVGPPLRPISLPPLALTLSIASDSSTLASNATSQDSSLNKNVGSKIETHCTLSPETQPFVLMPLIDSNAQSVLVSTSFQASEPASSFDSCCISASSVTPSPCFASSPSLASNVKFFETLDSAISHSMLEPSDYSLPVPIGSQILPLFTLESSDAFAMRSSYAANITTQRKSVYHSTCTKAMTPKTIALAHQRKIDQRSLPLRFSSTATMQLAHIQWIDIRETEKEHSNISMNLPFLGGRRKNYFEQNPLIQSPFLPANAMNSSSSTPAPSAISKHRMLCTPVYMLEKDLCHHQSQATENYVTFSYFNIKQGAHSKSSKAIMPSVHKGRIEHPEHLSNDEQNLKEKSEQQQFLKIKVNCSKDGGHNEDTRKLPKYCSIEQEGDQKCHSSNFKALFSSDVTSARCAWPTFSSCTKVFERYYSHFPQRKASTTIETATNNFSTSILNEPTVTENTKPSNDLSQNTSELSCFSTKITSDFQSTAITSSKRHIKLDPLTYSLHKRFTGQTSSFSIGQAKPSSHKRKKMLLKRTIPETSPNKELFRFLSFCPNRLHPLLVYSTRQILKSPKIALDMLEYVHSPLYSQHRAVSSLDSLPFPSAMHSFVYGLDIATVPWNITDKKQLCEARAFPLMNIPNDLLVMHELFWRLLLALPDLRGLRIIPFSEAVAALGEVEAWELMRTCALGWRQSGQLKALKRVDGDDLFVEDDEDLLNEYENDAEMESIKTTGGKHLPAQMRNCRKMKYPNENRSEKKRRTKQSQVKQSRLNELNSVRDCSEYSDSRNETDEDEIESINEDRNDCSEFSQREMMRKFDGLINSCLVSSRFSEVKEKLMRLRALTAKIAKLDKIYEKEEDESWVSWSNKQLTGVIQTAEEFLIREYAEVNECQANDIFTEGGRKLQNITPISEGSSFAHFESSEALPCFGMTLTSRDLKFPPTTTIPLVTSRIFKFSEEEFTSSCSDDSFANDALLFEHTLPSDCYHALMKAEREISMNHPLCRISPLAFPMQSQSPSLTSLGFSTSSSASALESFRISRPAYSSPLNPLSLASPSASASASASISASASTSASPSYLSSSRIPETPETLHTSASSRFLFYSDCTSPLPSPSPSRPFSPSASSTPFCPIPSAMPTSSEFLHPPTPLTPVHEYSFCSPFSLSSPEMTERLMNFWSFSRIPSASFSSSSSSFALPMQQKPLLSQTREMLPFLLIPPLIVPPNTGKDSNDAKLPSRIVDMLTLCCEDSRKHNIMKHLMDVKDKKAVLPPSTLMKIQQQLQKLTSFSKEKEECHCEHSESEAYTQQLLTGIDKNGEEEQKNISKVAAYLSGRIKQAKSEESDDQSIADLSCGICDYFDDDKKRILSYALGISLETLMKCVSLHRKKRNGKHIQQHIHDLTRESLLNKQKQQKQRIHKTIERKAFDGKFRWIELDDRQFDDDEGNDEGNDEDDEVNDVNFMSVNDIEGDDSGDGSSLFL